MSRPDPHVSDLVEQLSESQLPERAISEAPFGITIADLREPDQPLIFVNEGFLEITGYTEDEVLGRNCRFLQGEDTRDEPIRRMREAIERRETVQVDLRNYRKDGSEFWNEVTLAPIENAEGEVTHYVGFQQDVSARKAFEAELKEQRDDLTILNEMVRHDIRNDLQVALASMEVLQAEGGYDDNGHLETAIESIYQAVELTNTAKQVAELMLEGEEDLDPIQLTPILEAEIDDCRSSYPEADVAVDGTLPGVTVRANDLLHSVFRNLLVNAVRHNTAEEPTVRVAAWTHDDAVFVAVSDNGPGIPESERDHLFERGWSGALSSGTGLGLNIVSRLVDTYGGEISLHAGGERLSGLPPEGLPDLDGATFLLRLPLAE